MDLQGAVKGIPLEDVITDVLKANWDHQRTKFSLPPLMTLVSPTDTWTLLGTLQ